MRRDPQRPELFDEVSTIWGLWKGSALVFVCGLWICGTFDLISFDWAGLDWTGLDGVVRGG